MDGTISLYLDGRGIDEHFGVLSAKEKTVYLTDHLGSVLNAPMAGESRAYGAFGASTLIGKIFSQVRRDQPVAYGFTGRQYDQESGLYFYRARIYNPDTGRFMQKDPIGFAGGDLNLYRYVMNNPLKYIDPSGWAASIPTSDPGTSMTTIDPPIGPILPITPGTVLGYILANRLTPGLGTILAALEAFLGPSPDTYSATINKLAMEIGHELFPNDPTFQQKPESPPLTCHQ